MLLDFLAQISDRSLQCPLAAITSGTDADCLRDNVGQRMNTLATKVEV
jgi:hypothetical protein